MENFQIVSYKKGRNYEHEVVPCSWVIGTKCFFPQNNAKQMIEDPETKPDVSKWLSYQMIRTKRAVFSNYLEAVDALYRMLEESTSDTEDQVNERQWETRSSEHSKMPSNYSPEIKSEPKAPENSNMMECLESNESDANSSLFNYKSPQESIKNMQILETENSYSHVSSSAKPISNDDGIPSLERPNFTAGETFLIKKLNKVSTMVNDLVNSVNIIINSIENPSYHRKNYYNNSKILIGKKLIQNEEDLKKFEDQPDLLRKQLRSELLMRIGKRPPTDVRSCCLEVCDLLIGHEFWQYTSWAGGTKDEKKPKFALQNYQIFLNFFKDVIRETTDACFSDKEFAIFFQSKMKNRNQLPNNLKRAASRNRSFKIKRLEVSSDDVDRGNCED